MKRGLFSKAESIGESKIQETAPNTINLRQLCAPFAGFQLQTSWVLSALPSVAMYTKTSLEYNVTKH